MTKLNKQEYSRTNYRHSLHSEISHKYINAEKANTALGDAGPLSRHERRRVLKALKKRGYADPEGVLEKVLSGAGDSVEYVAPRT